LYGANDSRADALTLPAGREFEAGDFDGGALLVEVEEASEFAIDFDGEAQVGPAAGRPPGRREQPAP